MSTVTSFEDTPPTLLIECRVYGIEDIDECMRLLESFDTEAEEFVGSKPILAYECAEEGITDEFECSDFMHQERKQRLMSGEVPLFMMPLECQEADIREPEACKRYMEALYDSEDFEDRDHDFGGPVFDPLEHMPPPCRDADISDPQECADLMRELFAFDDGFREDGDFDEDYDRGGFRAEYLPRECFENNITTPEDCEAYLIALHMPPLCKERGAKSREECEAIVMERVMPAECSAQGATTEEDCERILDDLFMPRACKEAGVSDKVSCAGVIFAKHGKPEECAGLDDVACLHLVESDGVSEDFITRVEDAELPDSCREAGATSYGECERLNHERLLPLECREAGIFTPKGCEKHMFEKFRTSSDEELAALLPAKCVDTGVTEPRACKELMEADFFPSECAEAGIVDGGECRQMLEVRHMPDECRDVGITTRDECERHMRSKFMNPLCEAQGITDPVACEELVFSAIGSKVTCEGLTPDECAISVKKRHLGRILEAVDRADEIDAVIASVAGDGGTIDLDSLALHAPEAHDDALDILPIQGKKNRKLRALRSSAQVGVSADDEVRATTSVILIFDADGDGVPDDVERRRGLDPTNSDSDNDGISDADELREASDLAPIERAMLEGREIGQPLTEGEIDKKLRVRNIASPAEGADTDDVLLLDGSGVPGEVVTLYIYSGIAIVLTTTVDENGQWSYAMDEQLKDGMHEVYVVVNDDTGKVVRKSSPFSFIVSEARALTVGEAAAEGILDELSSLKDIEALPEVNVDEGSGVESSMRMFIIGAVVLVVFAVALAVVIFSPRKTPKVPKTDDEPPSED